VAVQYQLGQKLGITGTPTLIFEDGEMQPGYAPWMELLKRMNQQGS
jgi:thiol:disulfide interchange protein DsbC